jgi:Family of unknown function (DUF5329)
MPARPRLSSLLLVSLLLWTAPATAAPPPAVQREITQLLDYLATSGCRFQRGGTWHEGQAARKHLQMKLDYLAQRNMIRSVDDFIRLAASSSSMSGEAYKVQCGSQPPLPSGEWLGQELKRMRQQPPTASK